MILDFLGSHQIAKLGKRKADSLGSAHQPGGCGAFSTGTVGTVQLQVITKQVPDLREKAGRGGRREDSGNQAQSAAEAVQRASASEAGG